MIPVLVDQLVSKSLSIYWFEFLYIVILKRWCDVAPNHGMFSSQIVEIKKMPPEESLFLLSNKHKRPGIICHALTPLWEHFTIGDASAPKAKVCPGQLRPNLGWPPWELTYPHQRYARCWFQILFNVHPLVSHMFNVHPYLEKWTNLTGWNHQFSMFESMSFLHIHRICIRSLGRVGRPDGSVDFPWKVMKCWPSSSSRDAVAIYTSCPEVRCIFSESNDMSTYPNKDHQTEQTQLGGGFNEFFLVTPNWGNHPIWLIFFSWADTTNYRANDVRC